MAQKLKDQTALASKCVVAELSSIFSSTTGSGGAGNLETRIAFPFFEVTLPGRCRVRQLRNRGKVRRAHDQQEPANMCHVTRWDGGALTMQRQPSFSVLKLRAAPRSFFIGQEIHEMTSFARRLNSLARSAASRPAWRQDFDSGTQRSSD